jgi:FkbM family methyltransferase
MTFISYAQNYEDVMLWRALRDVEKGFYVDVGAADPEEWSVTRAFYDRGWSGINVEPLDEYFEKLKQARPRDTNLNVLVGREPGIRTLHAIAGTGLSTLCPETAARHQAAGWQAQEIAVPMLTLTQILEDSGLPSVHFLKIDVEGAEAEVLEGLDLGRVRPWIIVIEATEPFRTVSTRDKWEHRIVGHGYGFAYFDGLNCFYVADEVSELKERLAVPPNIFDDFIRYPELAGSQKTALVEQERDSARAHQEALNDALQAERAQVANLHSALQAEQARAGNLEHALQAEQAHVGNLERALQAERAQVAHLHNILQSEQVHHPLLLQRIEQLQAQMTAWDQYRGILGNIRELGDEITGGGLRSLGKRTRRLGDQITGGGLRSLTKRSLATLVHWAMRRPVLLAVGRTVLRPFPKLTTNLYTLGTTPGAAAIPSLSSPQSAPAPNSSPTRLAPSENGEDLATLPASARPIYRRLKAAMSDNNGWNPNQ